MFFFFVFSCCRFERSRHSNESSCSIPSAYVHATATADGWSRGESYGSARLSTTVSFTNFSCVYYEKHHFSTHLMFSQYLTGFTTIQLRCWQPPQLLSNKRTIRICVNFRWVICWEKNFQQFIWNSLSLKKFQSAAAANPAMMKNHLAQGPQAFSNALNTARALNAAAGLVQAQQAQPQQVAAGYATALSG